MLFQRAYTFYIEVLSQRASVKHLYWAGADSSNLSGRQLGVQREISHNRGGQTVVLIESMYFKMMSIQNLI